MKTWNAGFLNRNKFEWSKIEELLNRILCEKMTDQILNIEQAELEPVQVEITWEWSSLSDATLAKWSIDFI